MLTLEVAFVRQVLSHPQALLDVLPDLIGRVDVRQLVQSVFDLSKNLQTRTARRISLDLGRKFRIYVFAVTMCE